jgi:hypothetical protein
MTTRWPARRVGASALLVVAACARPSPPPSPPPGAAEPHPYSAPLPGDPEDVPEPTPPVRRPEPGPLTLPTGGDLAAGYRVAEDAFNRGELATAIGYFKGLYELQPMPEFLYNIATCFRLLDDCYGAAKYYERYLDAAPAAKNRAKVEALLAELRPRCPAE